MTSIYYKNGFKYQLAEEYSYETGIVPSKAIRTEYISLHMDGKIIIQKGYAWDGPSGPTVDTRNFMRGSLIHDALYQLMRERHLDPNVYRDEADQLLKKMCIEDGMWRIRAWSVYRAVKLFARSAASTSHKKPLYTAP